MHVVQDQPLQIRLKRREKIEDIKLGKRSFGSNSRLPTVNPSFNQKFDQLAHPIRFPVQL
jgi:intein/homing endonuclease